MPNALVQELYDELGNLLAAGDDTFIEQGPLLLQDYMEIDGFFDGVETEPAVDGYTRTKVIGEPGEHVIRFMEWPENFRLPPHEHHGRPCFEALVDGKLYIADLDAAPVDDDRYTMDVLGGYSVSPGETGVVDPRVSDIHEVHTVNRSRSLHVYPEDNATCTLYEPVDADGATDTLYTSQQVTLRKD